MLDRDRSADLQQLRSGLALNHTHPLWQNWARDQVELVKFEEQKGGRPRDWRISDKDPEQLPTPVTQADVEPAGLPQLQMAS